MFLTLDLTEHSEDVNGNGNEVTNGISFDSIMERLKKKAFDNDCYDNLAGSLQKLLAVSDD